MMKIVVILIVLGIVSPIISLITSWQEERQRRKNNSEETYLEGTGNLERDLEIIGQDLKEFVESYDDEWLRKRYPGLIDALLEVKYGKK